MSAAVAVPLSAINDQLGGVLPPSALVQNSPRHGRSRGMSMKGKKGRTYSVVEDRDVSIAKALMFVLKRTITEEEVDEEEEVDNLVADAEGWVGVDDVLDHPKLKALGADLDDIERVVANATKARFNLRQQKGSDAKKEDPAAWEIRRITNRDSITSPVPVGDKLTPSSEDLPEFIVYETSYQRYPLLVTQGAITKAPGGASYLSFQSVKATDEQPSTEAAEVSIWIHLKTALEAVPEITFQRTESGAIITSDEVPKDHWKKAVARRPDVGLLFEDGEVRKEVPAALRGKGARGKARKGKGASLKRDGSGDDSGSASEE
ncbi:hypothetical protein QBC47DRAFT_389287 [Echria macrotheca]|uniref:2'-phosphotransferase n=1 Tax=Echria macrotheca TaxID=438768 RepID=A0AAJ0B7S7_9PEZI|nr:hypothetical protein QBC47DRAFT_389287 [Echria macrotheca]